MNQVRRLFKPFLIVAFALALLVGSSSRAQAGNWPGWRGPRGNGISDETGLPVQWTANEGVRWKVPLPGKGVGTPVVWEDRILLTASDGPRHDELHFLCLDRRDGRTLWHRRFWGSAPTRYHAQKSSMATPTPVTDGEHVWAFFGTGDLFCLDLDGNLVWCRSLAQEYEPFQNRFGMASSPVLAGNILIVQCDHWGQSYVLGVHKRTGRNAWKTNRVENLSWSTPLVTQVDGRSQLIACGTFSVRGYDTATGEELWMARGLMRDAVPTPVAENGLILVTSGPSGDTLAIRAGGRGDITGTHVLWQTPRGAPFVPSPVLLDGLCYLINDRGIATCFEAATGKRVWQKRLGSAYTASPVAGDGKLYFVDEEGTTTVLSAGANAAVLSKNPLGEPVFASPAIADGEIFIRTDQHLFCIGRHDSPRRHGDTEKERR